MRCKFYLLKAPDLIVLDFSWKVGKNVMWGLCEKNFIIGLDETE